MSKNQPDDVPSTSFGLSSLPRYQHPNDPENRGSREQYRDRHWEEPFVPSNRKRNSGVALVVVGSVMLLLGNLLFGPVVLVTGLVLVSQSKRHR